MEKAEMIRKMTAAGIDLETALDIALGGKEPEKKEPEKKEPEKKEPEKKDPEKKDPEKKDPEKNEPEKKEQPAGISQEMGAQLLAAITKLTGAVQRSNVLTIGSDDEGESQQDKVDKMLTRLLSGEREGGNK